MYTRKQILELLKPYPPWNGFDDFVYEKQVLKLIYCINQIHTCWNWSSWGFNRPTFIEVAKMLKEKQIDYLNPATKTKIEGITNTTGNDYANLTIKVPTFLHRDLKRVWSAEYPENTSVPNEAYIAEDVNHRLVVYALKFLENPDIGDIQVELYLGHLNLY